MEYHQAAIWYDGQLVDWEQAKTHVLTHTLHYGMGVFEGLRVYLTNRGSAIFRLQDHIKRLFNSAEIVQMQLPYSVDEVLIAQKEVARSSQLPECYIRPMAFYGSKQLGVMPDESDVHLIIAAWQWGAYLGKEALQKGVKTKISSFCRHFFFRISTPISPAAISRKAVTVGLFFTSLTKGVAPLLNWRAR